MGGALAAAAAKPDKRAVHFVEDTGGQTSKKGRKGKKEKKDKKRKRARKGREQSESEETDDSSETSGDRDSRKERQRSRRRQGVELVEKMKGAASRSAGGTVGTERGGLGSSGTSPLPKTQARNLQSQLEEQQRLFEIQKQAFFQQAAQTGSGFGNPAGPAGPQPQSTAPPGGGRGTQTQPPVPPAGPEMAKVKKVAAPEMSKIFKTKKTTDKLRMVLVQFQCVDPEAAIQMTKVELLVAAAEAHNAGLLDVRCL
ncbi:hypothetical protein CYMTET_4775 [Cymbomonas tetramitiformis]|uniref:Uncharacterized protein n=1 Tax=Cymbomonas tetramitiformis TaxID=36881 RepID=A0AAE0H0P9_9CHLO|nr:hypothetical protein CYMTET_4775 [Cymbomonas tetramitiformis]